MLASTIGGTIDPEDTETWEQLEADWPAMEQARVDRVRVLGYLKAICDLVPQARDEYEDKVDEALKAQRRFWWLAERAELIARVYAGGEYEHTARALEGAYG